MIKQISVGPMLNLSYLVGDSDAGVCAVVDPGWDSGTILAEAEKAGLKIEAILLTHTHYDHTGALGDIAAETGAPVYVNNLETDEVKGLPLSVTNEGTVIDVGSLKLECMHTPGHTAGSQCFIVDGNILTGDTLFIDGCGRVDLPGSNPEDMLKSLRRLSELDPDTVVWPGHDYGGLTGTIGGLRKSNPYLSATNERAIV